MTEGGGREGGGGGGGGGGVVVVVVVVVVVHFTGFCNRISSKLGLISRFFPVAEPDGF